MSTRLFLVAIATAVPLCAFAQPSEDLHYWAVENLETHRFEQRGTANGNGNIFSNLILTPRTKYRIWVTAASTLDTGHVQIETARAGSATNIPPITLTPPNLFDSDGDRLPDLLETIVGTNAGQIDTDGDGVSDGAEVRQGTDPLDGLPARTGVIAAVDTPGQAQDVCATDNYVAVADGDGGVTVFNVFNRMNPRAIARVDLVGDTRRIACFGRTIAAVSNDDVALIDITDPPAARVVQRLGFSALRGRAVAVLVVDQVVFVSIDTGGELITADLATGTVLERITIQTGVTVRALAIEGLTVFALTDNRLHAIPLAAANLQSSASISMPPVLSPNQSLFVGGGTAYVASAGGYVTADVSNPSAMSVIARNRAGQFGWTDMVVNGAGVGLVAFGVTATLDNTHNLAVYDVRDTQNGLDLETVHTTPSDARAVEIFNGIAYVADHTNGLAAINYRSADTAGVPPTISLSGSVDLNANPLLLEEGKLVVVRADVTDDVEVRNVEFYIDGELVATDGNFPFEHQFTTPRLAQQTTINIRARASDTGGNTTFTPDVTVRLVPDNTSPMVLRVAPPPNALIGRAAAITGFFTEPLNLLTLVPQNFTLIEAGPNGVLGDGDDVPVAGGALAYRPVVGALVRTFPADLAGGLYRATLTNGLMDVAGNALSPEVTWDFRIYSAGTDSDGDGIPDEVEIALGLNPNNPDSDGDMTPDGDEDNDNDGLTNAVEIILLNDPSNSDSDGDMIPDGLEDQDMDGLTDGDEIARGTNPFNRDSDGDGFTDGDEVDAGSDPLVANDTPLRTAIFSVSVRNNSVPATNSVVATPVAVRNDIVGPTAERRIEGPTFVVEQTQ